MALETQFDPTLVRQTIRLAEEMEIARIGGNNALPAARNRFITFVENLTTREVQMLFGVMNVGAGLFTDLEDAIDAVAAKFEPKPVMALAMAEITLLPTHLNTGLKSLVIDLPTD